MTSLDDLILTMDAIHESLHRIYHFLGIPPACQAERKSESGTPQPPRRWGETYDGGQ